MSDTESVEVDPDAYTFYGDNPIDGWIFEVVAVHGAAPKGARIEQIEELVARLQASGNLALSERLEVASEVVDKHESMVNNLAFRCDSVSDADTVALKNAMERLIKAWVNEPRSMDEEVSEYAGELAYIKANGGSA